MCKVPTWSWLLITAITWQTTLSKEEPRVVCYYTNWSVYRPGTAKFNPQNINPYLCTHLIYAFGGFTKENNFKPFDKYQDIEKGGYAKFTGLKTYNKNLKTMLAIGGWNEGSSRFSPLVANPERRKELVRNSIKFLRQNHFDGLDLDWEYPSFRDGGKPRDKDNYAALVQELREEYDREAEKTGRPRLLLTMAVPAGIEYINKGYDVPKLMKYLDWMNILSYDYHSAFEPAVNHHSPLYSLEEASEYNYDSDLNINHTINHYLEAGAEPNKLVLGIPTYGRSYTLFNPEASQIGDPADGPGEMGDATRENGYLAYYEICEKLKDSGWTVENPNPNAMGPYAYKDNQWVGYDDEDIVKKKSEFVVERNLGGIMFWSIDNDDFRGNCNNKPYPLIEAAKEALLASMNKVDNTYRPKTRTRPNRKEDEPIETSRPVRKRLRPKVQEETAPKRKIKPKTTSTTTTTTARTTTVTPKYQTPEPPTTPDPGSDFKCEEDGFFPHPRDCKKYFWCLSSGPSDLGIVAHQFTCPSGLYFNKAADSCDYTQNVRCVKPKSTSTTSTTTTSTSTTTTTFAPYFSTRRVPPKITAATSRTTLLATTPASEEYEYEYEDDVVDSEEDPQVLKELINLIKKAGGIEELEKQLKLHDNGTASVSNTGATTPSVFSKTLYERVLKNTKSTETASNANRAINSRGPQYTVSTNESVRNRGRPQYTAINRQRPTTEKEEIETEEESEEKTKKRTSTVPEYISINRQRSSTVATPDSVSEKLIPEYVTIKRSRPSTETPSSEPTSSQTEEADPEPTTTASAQEAFDHLNAVEHNVTNFEPVTQRTTESVSRRYSEPSTTTAKVSDPISPKNILRQRPSQSDTIYTNRFKTPSARTTEAPITKATEEPVKDNRFTRRRGYTRFELPESYDQALPDPKYQDRKFRPDIAIEISDLSSLTSADIPKRSNGNGRRRIVSRQRTTDAPVNETTTSTVKPTTRNVVISRKPLRKLVTERVSTTGTTASSVAASSTSTETSTRPRRVIKRFRSTTSTSTTTTTTAAPSSASVTTTPVEITTEPLISATEKENLITDYDLFRTPEEEEENIKLSESNIREKSEIHINALNNNGIEQQKSFEKLGKTSHLDKVTESPNTIYRTRKIIRKLPSTTEIPKESTTPSKLRTRKIIRKIALAATTPKILEEPIVTELIVTETDTDKTLLTEPESDVTIATKTETDKSVITETERDETTVIKTETDKSIVTETDTDKPITEESATTTIAASLDSNEITTLGVSSTEPTRVEKITPFYYRAKLSRPPFVLQRSKAVTEPSTSTTQSRSAGRNGFKRFERRRPSSTTTTTTTTEKVITTTTASTTTPPPTFRNELIYTTLADPVPKTTTQEPEDYDSLETTHWGTEVTTETTETVNLSTYNHPAGTTEVPTTKSQETDAPSTQPPITTEPIDDSQKLEPTRKPYQSKRTRTSTSPTPRKIEDVPKSPNSLYKNNRTKNFKNKFINRSHKTTTTEPTTDEFVTLLHVFAETETSTMMPSQNKIEKLIEVNRIVEVSLKEGKMKSNTMFENEITSIPVIDRIGSISRVTNIKVVDSMNETETSGNNTSNYTSKPDLETSTIALEGLFRFRNEEDNDEVLETEHARYVNVKILNQDDASKPAELNSRGATIPLRILPQDEEFATSIAEVVEITPKYNSGLIRIAPIEISVKDRSQRNITLPSV
ncbi:hypothetical protein RN001_014524 [Aquatica leii]|uniref:chitinase n=1 Tax=Aquatica leii TaxID=1421715 RepID=A0AAN7PYK9_9COLE|nr:hypothetical protein RN001_014524 [Aquatica leii]